MRRRITLLVVVAAAADAPHGQRDGLGSHHRLYARRSLPWYPK